MSHSDTVIRIPGHGAGAHAVSDSEQGGATATLGNSAAPVDIIIYFKDKVGLHLKVIDGQNADAGELFELVLEEMAAELGAGGEKGVMDTARQAFSLWLVSDLLELQLKATHVPFKLICYWEELLEKYTSASAEARERDEAVIMFKRNVFYPRSDERKIKNTRMLKLLYHEARSNIIAGRYPLDQTECDICSGLQALITRRELLEDSNTEAEGRDASFGSSAYFKSRISQYLPPHLSRRNWVFRGSNPEKRIAQRFEMEQKGRGEGDSLEALYKDYLEFCRKKPYYGAAFFRGQAEHPGSRGLLTAHVDDPVYLAVNVDGVFVIDLDDVVLLLGLTYEEVSWQYVESSITDNPNCLSCIFLQFADEDRASGKTKLLQIFSKEAMLMDNIIQACISFKTEAHGAVAQRGAAEELNEERSKIVTNFKRLALVTLDRDGNRLDSNVRAPKGATTK